MHRRLTACCSRPTHFIFVRILFFFHSVVVVVVVVVVAVVAVVAVVDVFDLFTI